MSLVQQILREIKGKAIKTNVVHALRRALAKLSNSSGVTVEEEAFEILASIIYVSCSASSRHPTNPRQPVCESTAALCGRVLPRTREYLVDPCGLLFICSCGADPACNYTTFILLYAFLSSVQAGWTHQDGDTYVTEDVFRSECSASSPGESHGICDGFGTCQCAPPFIGDGCSTKVRRIPPPLT